MNSSVSLIEFLDRTPLPWLKYNRDTGKFEMVVDNHLLSTHRNCPQHFVEAHVFGHKRKAIEREGQTRHPWFLEFGVCVHDLLEYYYTNFRKPGFDAIGFCSKVAGEIWVRREMDYYSFEKEFQSIGGKLGFMGLAAQYAHVMTPLNEKFRVLATEIGFGKRKEVILHADEFLEVYLSGRIDILVDDGYFICPLDHKTKAYFGKSEVGLDHLIDEGPTGYIYALAAILPQIVSEEQILKRDCSKILMNYISKKTTERPEDRFRRIPIRKTSFQLEQYRLRMVASAQDLMRDMERLAVEMPIKRNTGMCQNWFHRQCPYFDLCRQGSADGYAATLSNGYVTLPIWDTENLVTEVSE